MYRLRFGTWKRVVISGMFVLLAALLLSACTGQVPRLDVAAGATAQPAAVLVMGTAVPGIELQMEFDQTHLNRTLGQEVDCYDESLRKEHL